MNHGWPQGTPAGGPGTGEPYPGFAQTHESYYLRQTERLREAQAAPPGSDEVFSIRTFLNPNAFPPARPGLGPEEQALYDSMKAEKRRKVLRMYVVLAVVFVCSVVLPIIRLLT